MRHMIRLNDFSKEEIVQIFSIADDLKKGKYTNFLQGKTVVMFFPSASIRTRITFEKGIYLLGGQSILFPPETLDKKEEIRDVMGYLNNWADALVVRHKDIHLMEEMRRHAKMPIINAMTDHNHPCEVTTDMYALSKMRENFYEDKFLFVGTNGNMGIAWKEVSDLMGFSLEQCCPEGHEIEGVAVSYQLDEAMKGKDIICTDSLSSDNLMAFQDFQITKERMELANNGAVLNPCPPFFRGEEVSADAIESPYFVGYKFKESLLEIQQAIIIFLLSGN